MVLFLHQNGYKLKIIKIENCAGPDAVVTVSDDFSLKLNKKCELVPTGCVKNKAFNSAVAKVKVTKDNVVLKEETVDICKLNVPDEAKDILKIFSAPDHCPVTEVCLKYFVAI